MNFAKTSGRGIFPTSRGYAWMAFIYLVLAIYGSLVPFKFHWLPWAEVLEQWHQLHFIPLKVQSRTDLVANILLFIPLSFLAMGAMCVDRPRRLGLLVGLALVPLCSALSAGIEFIQIYFPPRVPSASDIVAESLGGAVGVALWLTAGPRITDWLRQIQASRQSRGLAGLLLPGYLAFLVLINVLPLDLTLSPVEIYRKYRAGKITLVPFASFPGHLSIMVEKALWNAGYFFPVGAMLAFLPATSWENKRNWRRVLGLGLGLAGLIELLQLFVVTRYFDATDIIVESLGALAGWGAVRSWHLQLRSSPWRRFFQEPRGRALIFTVWLGLVVVFTWSPFDFNWDGALVVDRWSRLSWVPFADYWAGTEYDAFDQFRHKVLLYMPLGALLAFGAFWKGKHAMLRTVAASLSLATILELGQLFLPDRQASLTDIMVETLGSWIGFFWARSWCQSAVVSRPNAGKVQGWSGIS